MPKQPPCHECGNKTFHIRYTETAHAEVADDGDVLVDGINLVHHEMDYSNTWCAKCGAKIVWVGEEEVQ